MSMIYFEVIFLMLHKSSTKYQHSKITWSFLKKNL